MGNWQKKVASLTGAAINYLPNPRNEAVENDLIVDNKCFIELGLNPTTLDNGLLEEVVEVAKKYSNRCDLNAYLVFHPGQKQAEAIKTN